jgi:transcription elongation factor Elf1
VIRIVKKKLPTIFTCPNCSEEAVKVTMPKGGGVATIECAACGAKDQFDVSRGAHMVDVYCKFADKYHAMEGIRSPAQPTPEQGS